MKTLILDTGPLVGWLDASDHLHPWSLKLFKGLESTPVTCEPVLTEACHLLRSTPKAEDRIMELIQVGGLTIHPMLPAEVQPIRVLLARYEDQGIDLADACLVRLTELYADCAVITADVSDFRVYRRNGRQAIPLIAPPGR